MARIALPSSTIESLRKRSLVYKPTNIARYILAPNQTVQIQNIRTFRINEYGYRGEPFSVPKPKGVVRIIILGGSAVFDQNVSEGEDWPHLVQNNLRAKGFTNIEVVNAGIPGYTSFDSVGRLYGQIWMYEPDYLLLYNAWNDIKYFREVNLKESLLDWKLEYAKIVDPRLHHQGFLDQLFGHSELYSHVRARLINRLLNLGSEGIISDEEFSNSYSHWAPKQYEINMELFVDTSRNIGAIPILMTQGTLVHENNSVEDKKHINYQYQHLTHETLVNAYRTCHNIVKKVAKEKLVHFIDIESAMKGESQLFSDHVHLTSEGGHKIAMVVASFLEKEIKARD